MGRPPGTPEGRRTAREQLYREQAAAQAMKNARTRGETLTVDEAEARWGRIASEWTTAAQNLPAIAVQRGLIPRDREADLQALVDELLLERISAVPVPA